MSPLPQDEPSDDFKAGWDKALAVAVSLISPKPLAAGADGLDRASHATSAACSNAVAKLRGAYQFRHLKDS